MFAPGFAWTRTVVSLLSRRWGQQTTRRGFLGRVTSAVGVATAIPLALKSPSAPRLPGDPQRGQALFAKYGASCHGPDLQGGVGPPLNPITKLPGVKDPLDPQYLIHTITYGRSPSGGYGTMPPKGGISSLSDQDIRDLAAFVIDQNRNQSPTLSADDLARSDVFWISAAGTLLLGVAYLLSRYNMRWIRRRNIPR